MNYQLRFPALARASLTPSTPFLPCRIAFMYDDAARQASILLELELSTTDNTQLMVLEYSADNIKRGASLDRGSGDRSVSSLQREKLQWSKEDSRTDFKELSIDIKQPCPVWRPELRVFGSESGYEPSLHEFVELARATTLRFFFDYQHVRSRHQSMFKAFRTAAKGLRGYPVEAGLEGRGLKKSSWEVFGSSDAVGAPPAYVAPRKRRRQTSPGSPAPLSKRSTSLSPTGSCSSDKTVPFSPSTAAEAFRRALGKASPDIDTQTEAINAAVSKQLTAHIHDIQTQSINAVVDKQLPAHLDKILHAEAINAAVNTQVQTCLNNVLPTLLPEALKTLLDGVPKSSPGSPATSFTSIDSRGNRYPRLPPLTPLALAFIERLRTQLEEKFQQYQAHQLRRFQKTVDKTLDELERSAYDDRAREAAEFETVLEEHKAEVEMVKTDTIEDLWRETEHVFAQSKEEGWALAEDISDRLTELCDKIDRLKRVRLRKLIVSEVSRQRRSRKGLARGDGVRLVRGEQKLLGRWRESEDVEWIDC